MNHFRHAGALRWGDALMSPKLSLASFLSTETGRASEQVMTGVYSLPATRIGANEFVGWASFANGKSLIGFNMAARLPGDQGPASAEVEARRTKIHKKMLRSKLGEPPYVYSWGSARIVSNDRSWDFYIAVTYTQIDPASSE